MKKTISLLLFLSLAVFSYAEVDPIADFSNESISVLNEQLRKLEVDEKVKADANDTSSGYLSDKVKNSIVVDSYDLQLSGDASAPGNNKVYGTNATGTKGWKADPTVATGFWNNAATSVFSGVAPTTWTDLDINGTVGANYALVLFKVACTVATGDIKFRPNGDNVVFSPHSVSASAGGVSNSNVFILCKTDSAGVVEWMTDLGPDGTTVTVEGYVK